MTETTQELPPAGLVVRKGKRFVKRRQMALELRRTETRLARQYQQVQREAERLKHDADQAKEAEEFERADRLYAQSDQLFEKLEGLYDKLTEFADQKTDMIIAFIDAIQLPDGSLWERPTDDVGVRAFEIRVRELVEEVDQEEYDALFEVISGLPKQEDSQTPAVPLRSSAKSDGG